MLPAVSNVDMLTIQSADFHSWTKTLEITLLKLRFMDQSFESVASRSLSMLLSTFHLTIYLSMNARSLFICL